MEYHLSTAGQRTGPHTQFHLIEGIREGRLKGDELVWHVGLDAWQPLRAVREFEEFWPVSEETLLQAETARQRARSELDRPRPWLRFWARTLDYLWFSQVFALFASPWIAGSATAMPNEPLMRHIWMDALAILPLLLYVPVEAWLLSKFGTTPGRALLRVQVRRLDGGLPHFSQALRRSFQVYVKGVALGLPFIYLIAMLWSRMRLLQDGASSWDEANETRVEHGEPEPWRYMVLAGLIALVAVLAMLLVARMAEQMSPLPD
jgi:uncharacterized RDD family membrane protein YckC